MFKAAKYTVLPTTDAVISVTNALVATGDNAVSIPSLKFARGVQLLIDTPPAGVVAPPVDEDEDQPPPLIEGYDSDEEYGPRVTPPKAIAADYFIPLEDQVTIERQSWYQYPLPQQQPHKLKMTTSCPSCVKSTQTTRTISRRHEVAALLTTARRCTPIKNAMKIPMKTRLQLLTVPSARACAQE